MADDRKNDLAAWVEKSADTAFNIADAVDSRSPEKLKSLPANTELAKKLSDTGFESILPLLFPQYLAEKTTIELSMARESFKETGGSFGFNLVHTPLNLSYQKRYRHALATRDQLTVHVERTIVVPNK